MHTQTYKKCGECRKTFPVSEFSIKNKITGLLRSKCKACVREYGKKHYSANVQTYVDKAATRNAQVRETNKKLVSESLLGKCCKDCGCTESTDLKYYNGSIENGQPVQQAVHNALGEAAVLDAISRSVVFCSTFLKNHFYSNIQDWGSLNQVERDSLTELQAAAGIKALPRSHFKNYKRITRLEQNLS